MGGGNSNSAVMVISSARPEPSKHSWKRRLGWSLLKALPIFHLFNNEPSQHHDGLLIMYTHK